MLENASYISKGNGLSKKSINDEKLLENCTFVKTVLMIIVVLYHSILFWNGTWFTKNPIYDSEILGFVARWLNTFHIYGFTFVSGYIFYELKYKKLKYREFIPFVKNKVARLLVPFVFVMLIWCIPFSIFYMNIELEGIIINYLLGASPSQLWFLLMLFNVFIIFDVLADYFEKNTLLSFVICCIFYVIGLICDILFLNYFQMWKSFQYIIFFWLGFKTCQYKLKKIYNIPSIVLILVDLLLFIFSEYLQQINYVYIKVLNLGLRTFLYAFGAIMIFVILQKFASNISYQSNRIYKVLSRNSMSIYLFHQQVIYVIISTLNGRVNPYLHSLINFIVSIIVSIIISNALRRFSWTKRLLGEKS